MLGRQYGQGRDDVWHATPREIDGFLKDWAEMVTEKAKASAKRR